MAHITTATMPGSFYQLSWTHAPGSMFAFDCESGRILNVNLAAVVLTGFSSDELTGMSLVDLHPEGERDRADAEIQKAIRQPAHLPLRYHIQSKDGRSIPVMISSSQSLPLDGRPVVNFVYLDISELEESEHRLTAQNWALSAYAGAALALAPAQTSQELLTAVCKAIVRESIYVLAWVGIAEDGEGKQVRIAAAEGSAVNFLYGMPLSWAPDEQEGQGPTGICIRTNELQSMLDSEKSEVFAPWRQRAMKSGIRSAVWIPLRVEGGWRGALIVY